jgi:hypothetical protein
MHRQAQANLRDAVSFGALRMDRRKNKRNSGISNKFKNRYSSIRNEIRKRFYHYHQIQGPGNTFTWNTHLLEDAMSPAVNIRRVNNKLSMHDRGEYFYCHRLTLWSKQQKMRCHGTDGSQQSDPFACQHDEAACDRRKGLGLETRKECNHPSATNGIEHAMADLQN